LQNRFQACKVIKMTNWNITSRAKLKLKLQILRAKSP